jgi:DNA-binding protein HU-beta
MALEDFSRTMQDRIGLHRLRALRRRNPAAHQETTMAETKSVTKAELISMIASDSGLRKVDAEKALAAMTTAIQASLKTGKKVTLLGFGTFSVAARKARTGRNPQNKKPLKIPASKAVRFKPGKAMKEAVNK